MIFYKKYKKHSLFVGATRAFHGIGAIIRVDHSFIIKTNIILDIRILWFKLEYAYTSDNQFEENQKIIEYYNKKFDGHRKARTQSN